jgi:hypothetical protein
MHIMVTDFGAATQALAERLEALEHGVTVVTLKPGEDGESVPPLEAFDRSSPFLVVTRVPASDPSRLDRLGATVLFPGRFRLPGSDPSRQAAALLVPGATMGPVYGAPRKVERRLARLLSGAGLRPVCRSNLQAWLRVTSAWLAPLRGAVIAAGLQGLSLSGAPDLVTIATRAARERLLVLRRARYELDARSAFLLALPEWWAIRAMRRVARALCRNGSEPYLPSAVEAGVVSRRAAALARRHKLATPAADFLDQFSAEDAEREKCGDKGAGCLTVATSTIVEVPETGAAPLSNR